MEKKIPKLLYLTPEISLKFRLLSFALNRSMSKLLEDYIKVLWNMHENKVSKLVSQTKANKAAKSTFSKVLGK